MTLPDLAAAARLSVPIPRSLLSHSRVLVVGDVMLDRYWFGDVGRISPEAPVPVVQVMRSEDRLGGAANVARNIVSLGGRCSLLGLLGDDDAGICVQQMLRADGIHDRTRRDPARQTVVKLRVLGRQQQLLRIDFDARAGEQAAPYSEEALHSLIRQHDLVVLSDYAKGGLGDPRQVIAAAVQQGRPVLVDPKGEDFSRYAGATMITPNLSELRLIVGSWRDEEELAAKAQALRLSLCIESLLLTRSADGMSLFDASGSRHFPAQAREVFDVSGAGDTAMAVLALLLATGINIDTSIALANRAAGLVVAKLGTATIAYEELFVETDDDALIARHGSSAASGSRNRTMQN